MAIKDGKFVAVGGAKEVEAHRGDKTRVIDVGGRSVVPGLNDSHLYYLMNGAGEMLVFSAADFEDFLEPRPDLPRDREAELKEVVTLLAKNRWGRPR